MVLPSSALYESRALYHTLVTCTFAPWRVSRDKEIWAGLRENGVIIYEGGKKEGVNQNGASSSLSLSMFSRDGGRRGTRTRYLSKRSFEKDIDPVGNRRDDASIDRGRSHLPSFGNLKIGHGRL